MPGLEDLYREIILDHYRSPRNRGELPTPPATRVEGFNPLCGDEIVVYVDVQDGAVDVEGDDDLVAAQRVEPLGPHRRGRRQLSPVPGVAVVVEDDLAVEVFET